MWIERLVLKNYRQYRDATIEFAPPGRSGFTVIQGANGSGKTNLLNAITWCLYATEHHLTPKYVGLPIFHAATAERLTKAELAVTEVQLTLRESGGNRIVINRSLKFRARGPGQVEVVPDSTNPAPDGSKLTVIRQIRKDMIPVTDAQFVVQKLIPEGLEEYFLFDGERLDSYFKETSGQQIKDAVYKISQLDLLERLIDHLRKKQTEFVQDQKYLSPQAERARADLETAERSVEKLKAEVDELKAKKAEAERKERELSENLKSLGPENISKLQDERENLDRDIQSINDLLGSLESERLELLISAAPAILTLKSLEYTRKLIEETEESGEIPPAYRQSFLEKLLSDRECICGTALEPGTSPYQAVQSLSKRTSGLSEMSAELIEENGNVRRLLDDAQEFPEQIKLIGAKVQNQQSQLTRKSERLEQINTLIGNSDVAAVKQMEKELERFRIVKEGLIAEVASKDYRLEQEAKEVERLRSELEQELLKEKKHQELLSVLKFCKESVASAERIRDEIMVDVRREIEEKTRAYFLGLIWKRDTYKTVAIDDDYNVSVVHQSGRESLGTLSAGERQVLALSFVAALNGVSGFDVPIVIDTPLARISREPRRNIALSLPRYLQGKQVVLLVTEEEYTSDVRDALRESTGKEWVISYHERKTGAEAEVLPYER